MKVEEQVRNIMLEIGRGVKKPLEDLMVGTRQSHVKKQRTSSNRRVTQYTRPNPGLCT